LKKWRSDLALQFVLFGWASRLASHGMLRIDFDTVFGIVIRLAVCFQRVWTH
jgi:hypothetical protein